MPTTALASVLGAIATDECVPEIAALFVSATAKDVRVYRKRVQQALQQAGLSLSLQEDLVEGAVEVVQLCHNWLHQSDGYIGIFGFRYGWIPDSETYSITHLECRWALGRWPGGSPCPVFLFLPEKGSQAERFLKEAAETALHEEFPDSIEAETKREESRRAQAKFLSWIGQQGRFIQHYTDETDLCARALNSVHLWNRKALSSARKGRKLGGLDDLPSSLLGAIDREPQLDALAELLEAAGERGHVPAACILVHGPEGTGQYEFLAFLAEWFEDEWDGWRPGPQVHEAIRRQPNQNAAALLKGVLAQLAPDRQQEEELAAAVAKAALDRCREQPQVLRLTDVDRIEGGLAAFHGGFWAPLFAALEANRQPSVHRHPLVVLATSSAAMPAPLSPPLEDALWTAPSHAALPDGRKLLPLPRLTPLDSKDVSLWLRGPAADWLEQAGRVPLGVSGRRHVAEMVTAESREPRHVFDELRKTRIWSDNG